MDKFGDGWDTAKLSVQASRGNSDSFSLSCGENRIHHHVCFYPGYHQHGDYMLLSIVGYKPAYPWEIFWQVLNENTGAVYSGTYMTTMKFTYRDYESDKERIMNVFLQSSTDLMEESDWYVIIIYFNMIII